MDFGCLVTLIPLGATGIHGFLNFGSHPFDWFESEVRKSKGACRVRNRDPRISDLGSIFILVRCCYVFLASLNWPHNAHSKFYSMWITFSTVVDFGTINVGTSVVTTFRIS